MRPAVTREIVSSNTADNAGESLGFYDRDFGAAHLPPRYWRWAHWAKSKVSFDRSGPDLHIRP